LNNFRQRIQSDVESEFLEAKKQVKKIKNVAYYLIPVDFEIDGNFIGYIKFKRGSGSIIFSQNYGRIVDDFSFEADFGNMDWNGFIIKDNAGSFEKLDLELSLKLNLQENIPWYAAIFGGLGVAAGTAIIGNVFEEQIEDISTIEYSVKGPLNSPNLERL